MKKNLSFSAIVLLCLSSCKKSSSEETLAITKENLVGSYKIGSVMVKASGTPEYNATDDLYEACEKDDITTLNADFTLVNTDAGTQCSPVGNYEDTWSLTGNFIEIEGYLLEIQKITRTSLVAKTDYMGTDAVFTYSRQ